MTKKFLVAYTTNAGSTREVAETVADELGKGGAAVDVQRLEKVTDLNPYQAVVVGAPMILGWHRGATKFLKQHQQALSQIPVAYFFTAMSLTETGKNLLEGVPVEIDPDLPKDPKNPSRLGFRENYSTVDHYLGPVLHAVPKVKPVSVGIFGGKVDYTQLKLLHMLFVMLIVGSQPGDRRNWTAIQKWAAGLCSSFYYS